MTTLGNYIREARESRGLNQVELASKIFKDEKWSVITPQYLNDIELGRRTPKSEYLLESIAYELRLNVDYVMYLAGVWRECRKGLSEEKFKKALKNFLKVVGK